MAGAGVALAGVTGAAAVHWLAERRAARLRREFAQGVSHELRTPLAHIQMYSEMLLLEEERSGGEPGRWLEIIGREAHRLGDMVENLIDFAHGPGPAEYPVQEPVDLGTVLEDVAAVCAPLAAAREMRIDADPPAGVTARVNGRALRQAVLNLVDNAVRHGAPGQTVTLALHPGPGRATLSVADQGPGIAPRDRDRVWEPFVKVGTTGGIGLGLAAVRRFAAAHKGGVFVDDAPGGGARFGIVLPTMASRRIRRDRPAMADPHPAGGPER